MYRYCGEHRTRPPGRERFTPGILRVGRTESILIAVVTLPGELDSDVIPYRRPAAIFGVLTTCLLYVLSATAAHFWMAHLGDMERVEVSQEASRLRARLENVLNEKLSMERGLVAYIETNPDMTTDEFNAYTSALIMDDPVIRNISVIKGTVIGFAFPYQGNEAAIGKDLSLIPEQAPTLRLAMETRKPILSGPLDLVQGGRGIITRMGIFPIGELGPEYWGQASVVLNEDEVYRQVGFYDATAIRLAIRKVDERGVDGPVFLGDESVFLDEHIALDVVVPGGSWRMAAVPAEGWPRYTVYVVASVVILLGLSTALGVVIYLLVSARGRLAIMAYRDQLTGMPNRLLFWDRLSVTLPQAERDGRRVALLMLDMDGFKEVNDTLGHAAGDAVLVEAAARLSAAFRRGDTVARLGGDEFAVIAPLCGDAGARIVAAKAESCFTEAFRAAGSIKLSASVGMAVFPDDTHDPEELLAMADRAMYKVKIKPASASRTNG